MRLLIRLISSKDQQYQIDYHYSIQGFIYNLLRDSSFEYLHEKEGYKFFCFSNIFPYSNTIKKGERKYLLISSPSNDLIMHIKSMIRRHRRIRDVTSIGDMRFIIESSEIIYNNLRKGFITLVSSTPIVVRIPREKYRALGITPSHEYDYLYWRSNYPLDIFVEQLEKNLFKKYREYTGLDIEGEIVNMLDYEHADRNTEGIRYRSRTLEYRCTGHIISGLRFIKQVAKEVSIHEERYTIIGTLWEFWFDAYDDSLIKLLRFALDSGFGERNSLGFGFMNLKV